MRNGRTAPGLALAVLAVATIVLVLMHGSPGWDRRDALDTRLGDLKARLARAVASAEHAVDGKAESIRLETDGALSPWVIVVDAHGKTFDVVVDRSGTIVSMAEHRPSRPAGTAPSIDAPSVAVPVQQHDEAK